MVKAFLKMEKLTEKKVDTEKLKKEELIKKLENIENLRSGITDAENWHMDADDLLLEYINDKDIEKAFNNVKRWYA
jgi:hypothetical protein